LNYFFPQPSLIIFFSSYLNVFGVLGVDSCKESDLEELSFSSIARFIIIFQFANRYEKIYNIKSYAQSGCPRSKTRTRLAKPCLSAGLCIGYTAVVNSPVDRRLSLITCTITPANTIAGTMYAPPNGRRNSFPRKFPAICETSRRASTSYQGRLYKAP